MAATHDISIDQGTDFTQTFVRNDTDLTGYAVKMQVRADYDKPALLEASTLNGKFSAPDNAGAFTLTLVPADTTNIKFKGDSWSGVYDIELTSGSGAVERLLQGTFTISREVTR